MAAEATRPIPSSAAPYLAGSPDRAALQVPARDFVVQGLIVAGLMPLLCVLVGFLVGFVAGDGDPAVLGVVGPLVVVGMIASFVLGLGMVAASGWNSGRTLAVLDREGFALPGGRALPRDAIRAIGVRKPNPGMKWIGLAARTDGGFVILLGRVPPSRSSELAAAAAWLGEALGVPVEASEELERVLGMTPNRAAATCYVPVYGVWLIVSVGTLMSTTNAHARFAARQSLAFYVLSSVALVGLVLALVILAIALDGSAAQPVLVGLMTVALVGATVGRLVIAGIAAWRAYQGVSWPIPGLGWLGAAPSTAVAGPGDGSVWQPPAA
jgi:hypothetical protein